MRWAAVSDSKAKAIGIHVEVNRFDGTIENNRAIIMALAVSETGDENDLGSATGVQAFGIRVEDNGNPDPNGLGTIINDGGEIYTAMSVDGGDTFHRATAIDLTESPHPWVIHLKGNEHWGHIFGDINLGFDEDEIIVSEGLTSFNGIVNNPNAQAAIGTMTILEGGTFFMRLNEIDGASQVNVDTFIQESSGTLKLEINSPATVPFDINDHFFLAAGPPDNFIGQVNADTVELDGHLLLRVVTPQLFPNFLHLRRRGDRQ
jgi:hypothetical protein